MLTQFKDTLESLDYPTAARYVYRLFSDEYLSSDVLGYIAATHCYHEAIQCIDKCDHIIANGLDCLTKQELDYLHDMLIQIRLDCLYHLNYWNEYIDLYDSFIPTLPSTVKCQSVYETVKNKQDQLLHGKNVDALKCKHKKLTFEELKRTNEYFIRRMRKHLEKHG